MLLEDECSDILKKARLGQALALADLARLTGVPEAEIAALERGTRPGDRTTVRALASALGLRPGTLEHMVWDCWVPRPSVPIAEVETIHGDIGGYAVKGYVIHDAGEALLVDTAYNASAMIAFLESRRLRLVGICLTHGHADHAEGLEPLLRRWHVPVYLGADDIPLLPWHPPDTHFIAPTDGRTISVGGLTARCMTTPGHTPGGTCYVTEVQKGPACFVGDTLFAGSIGRSNPPGLYATHLDSVRQRVLKLPLDCTLLPGHGPATTVREELDHNPFSATL